MTLKLNKQARLGVAVAAVIGGATIASDVTFARPNAAGAGFAATNTGQVAVVPYYTVQDNWITALNLTNVSNSAILVKVRVHEGHNSRDVLDFNIMMSPKDVWTGYLAIGQDPMYPDDPRPFLFTDDNSCLTPEFNRALEPDRYFLSPDAYTGPFSDGGDEDNGRLKEGYIEFITMGECLQGTPCMTNPNGIGWLTKHVDTPEGRFPRNCAAAIDMSRPTVSRVDFPQPGSGSNFVTNPAQRHGAPDYRDDTPDRSGMGYGAVVSLAPLKGNVSYLRANTGIGAGAEALHLDRVIGSGLNPNGDPQPVNLVTAQDPPYFLEPTIATVPRGLWDARGLTRLENRFTWSSIYNEWADNPETGATVDWIVNFPTKAFHVDQFCRMIQANNNAWRNDGSGVFTCADDEQRFIIGGAPAYRLSEAQSAGLTMTLPPFNRRWRPGADGVFGSPIDAQASIYDREELDPTPVISPGPEFSLAYETNVIRFTADRDDSPTQSRYSNYLDPHRILPAGAESIFGWMDLRFVSTFDAHPAVPTRPAGLPAYGFIFKVRDMSNPGQNYGQMMNHGYDFRAAPNSDGLNR